MLCCNSATGLSVALHFGADNPAPNVTAAVVTASNASTAAAIVDLDIRDDETLKNISTLQI